MAPKSRAEELSLAVDLVVFGIGDKGLAVLLIQRRNDPFAGRWALPGGFVEHGEEALSAARRELKEETGVGEISLRQLHAFTAPRRDPRGRVVSITHYGILRNAETNLRADSDAAAAQWFALSRLPPLAFDHNEMIRMARQRLREDWIVRPIDRNLFPGEFKIGELRRVYEWVFGRKLPPSVFARRMLRVGMIRPAGRGTVSHDRRYRLNAAVYGGRRSLSPILDERLLAGPAKSIRKKR